MGVNISHLVAIFRVYVKTRWKKNGLSASFPRHRIFTHNHRLSGNPTEKLNHVCFPRKVYVCVYIGMKKCDIIHMRCMIYVVIYLKKTHSTDTLNRQSYIFLWHYLVGGLGDEICFSIQLGISSSQLTFTPSFFRGVETYHQPVYISTNQPSLNQCVPSSQGMILIFVG